MIVLLSLTLGIQVGIALMRWADGIEARRHPNRTLSEAVALPPRARRLVALSMLVNVAGILASLH